jgi:2-polyprenyl-6-methoxyphenol hydroxylase-like FAD-dependent oxidoreductase
MDNNFHLQPIAVLGAGPAGMAVALGLLKAGHKVVVYERYRAARPAGTILNLWPPPVKALGDMGVDITDLGSPCATRFRSASGTIRATVNIDQDVAKQYGGGFLGLLRPDLYTRMLDSIPEGTIRFDRQVSTIESHHDHVTLRFTDGEVVETPVVIGCDGIDSIVRKKLWGDTPKRLHNLHVIGGYTFDDSLVVPLHEVAVSHNQTVQATYSSIRSKGRTGYQWWILEAFDDQPDREGPADILAHGMKLSQGFKYVPQLIAATPASQTQRWVIRDRVPLKRWSKGRITLAGDAAHPTSPYAAYGAGMSICDGYFIGQSLAGVNLADTSAVERALVKYEQLRIPHTTDQVNQAYFLGQLFHHSSWLMRPIRDIIFDWTPFLQRKVGDRNPGEILKQLDEMGDGILFPRK